MAKILVISEHRDGKLSESTLELCKAAKEIASGLGCEPAAAIFASDDTIKPEDLNLPAANKTGKTSNNDDDVTVILNMEDMEKSHIVKALNFYGWDRAKTAYKLGISIKTLYSKIIKYSLTQNKYY